MCDVNVSVSEGIGVQPHACACARVAWDAARDACRAIAAQVPLAASPVSDSILVRHAAGASVLSGRTAAAWVDRRAAEYVTRGWAPDVARRQAWLDWEVARLCGGDMAALRRVAGMAQELMEAGHADS